METIVKGVTSDKFLEKMSRNFIGITGDMTRNMTKGSLMSTVNTGFSGLDTLSGITSSPLSVGLSGSQYIARINGNFSALKNNKTTLNSRRLSYVMNGLGSLICLGMCTYVNAEITTPQNLSVFTATQISVSQWLDACQSAGMTYIVFAAMHHDGFKMWNCANSAYNITGTDWYKNHGGYDIVGEVVRQCRVRGLYCILYTSIWDRSENVLNSNEATLPIFKAAMLFRLTELLTNYGFIDGLWLDGWGWALNGYNIYSYNLIHDHVMSISPNTIFYDNCHEHPVVHSDIEGYEFNADNLIPLGNTRLSRVIEV